MNAAQPANANPPATPVRFPITATQTIMTVVASTRGSAVMQSRLRVAPGWHHVVAVRVPGEVRLYVDGTQLERITKTPGFDGFPMFSPDGKRLAFASNRASRPGTFDTNVFVTEWVPGSIQPERETAGVVVASRACRLQRGGRDVARRRVGGVRRAAGEDLVVGRQTAVDDGGGEQRRRQGQQHDARQPAFAGERLHLAPNLEALTNQVADLVEDFGQVAAGPILELDLVVTALAVRLVGSWPEMGSRYDAPGTHTPEDHVVESERDLWNELDEGRDPQAYALGGHASTLADGDRNSLNRCFVCALGCCTTRPLASQASAQRMPRPPALVRIVSRGPAGRGGGVEHAELSVASLRAHVEAIYPSPDALTEPVARCLVERPSEPSPGMTSLVRLRVLSVAKTWACWMKFQEPTNQSKQ